MKRISRITTIGAMLATVIVLAAVAAGAHIYRYEAIVWLSLLLLWEGAYLGRISGD